MKKRWLVAASVVGMVALATRSGDSSSTVSDLLRLAETPTSIRNVECHSSSITDYIVYCAFEVAPQEFDKLLAGWRFPDDGLRGYGSSHDQSDHRIGEPFDIAARYRVEPKEFKHGGVVELIANADRSRVKLYYSEQ